MRIELFGDQIESLRQFEVSTQRSLQSLDAVEITVLRPTPSIAGISTEYLAAAKLVHARRAARDRRRSQALFGPPGAAGEVHDEGDVLTEIYRFPSVTAAGVASGSLEATCHLRIESVERFSGDIGKVRDELDSAAAGQDVILVCQTEAEIQRLQRNLRRHAAAPSSANCISPSAICKPAFGWSTSGSCWSAAMSCFIAAI